MPTAVYLSRLLSMFVVLRKQLSFLNSTHAPSTDKLHCWCWLRWHNDDPKQLTLFDGKNLPPMHLNFAPPVKSWGSEVPPTGSFHSKDLTRLVILHDHDDAYNCERYLILKNILHKRVAEYDAYNPYDFSPQPRKCHTLKLQLLWPGDRHVVLKLYFAD